MNFKISDDRLHELFIASYHCIPQIPNYKQLTENVMACAIDVYLKKTKTLTCRI